MGRRSKSTKRGTKPKRANAKAPAPERRFPRDDGAGYDFGVAGLHLAIATPHFAELLTTANTWGCAYGLQRAPFASTTIPVVSLVATRAGPMIEVFELMHEWRRIGGPGAVVVEMAYSGDGYTLGISQDARALGWRTLGFDTVTKATPFNLSWGKLMDTRQPFLDELADYGDEPFAPVLLYGAIGEGPSAQIEILDQCEPILLGRLPVYRTEDEIPSWSVMAGMNKVLFGDGGDAEASDQSEQNGAQSDGPDDPMTPELAASERDRRMISALPKTMLMLRHSADGKALVAKVMALGYARWQAEQALANLQLAGSVAHLTDYHRRKALRELRRQYAEFAGQACDLTEVTPEIVVAQIEVDLGFLLASLSTAPVPDSLARKMERLRELGHA